MLNEIVFDIETQNTFAEVDNDFKKFRVSVVSIYSYIDDSYQSFTENEIGKLWPILEKADRIIGYNSEHFDLPILNNYYLGDLSKIAHLDLMKQIKESVGIRLKLSDVAEATLDNINKSAHGLQAITWWREGKIDEIKKYCEQDVKVTKMLYEFGRDNRQLFYKSLTGEILPFAVNFQISDSLANATGTKNINLTLPF
jgi:DEAD/DEAH box helicase domain-containing protein